MFYEPLGGGRFRATEHTVGPWSDKAQHLGPPSALLVRELERCAPREDTALRRVAVDVLGPVPVDEIEVRAEVIRPGRSVELLSAELSAAGRVAAIARAWRTSRGDTEEIADEPTITLPAPENCSERRLFSEWNHGYVAAMEWRFAAEPVPGEASAKVWSRPRVALVGDEETSPLARVFTVADSASGVSSRLAFGEWNFANVDLTVHLHRDPAGEWVGMDAETALGPRGSAVAASVLHDAHGPIGRSAQSLFLGPLKPR